MIDLWHFTCEHGYAGLSRSGVLLPNSHVLMPELGPVIWLTSDPAPSRDAVGLTSSILSCDRMAYRYAVVWAPSCLAWAAVRDLIRPSVVRDLESFGRPESWWISRLPLRAVFAPMSVAAGGSV